MIDTTALRKRILDLAIRGKLVPQDPNDEPASVLLERIRAEKQRLIKEGKIKKDKGDSIIFKGDDNCHYEKIGNEIKCIEDEIPFEIPDGWCWVRIENVFSPISSKGNQILSSEILPEGRFAVVSQSQDYIDGYSYDNTKVIYDSPVVIFGDHTKIVKYIDFPFILGADGTKVLKPILCNPKFLYYIIYDSADKINSKGYARHYKLLKQSILTLPPLEEQQRIVKNIEEIFNQIDLIEQNQIDYNSLVATLKKAVLQSAIQGKLVEQDPTDEPASVLLERIRAEKKKQLGKKYVESYIYKGDDNCYYEKIGSTVKNITEETPFDIPESWEWARLKTFIDFSKNNTVKASEIQDDEWVLDLEDIEKGTGKVLKRKTMLESASKSDKHKFYKGNILYSKLRPYLNKVLIADEDGYCTTEILVFDFGDDIINSYAKYFLMSPYFLNYATDKSLGDMPRVRSVVGNNGLIPIPPQYEQLRICEIIKYFLSIIEKDED